MDTLHKILDLMWKKGMSDIEFCQAAGINKSAVTDWKKGKTKSYYKHIEKIAEILDTSADYLLGQATISNTNSKKEGMQMTNKEFFECWYKLDRELKIQHRSFIYKNMSIKGADEAFTKKYNTNINTLYAWSIGDYPLHTDWLDEHILDMLCFLQMDVEHFKTTIFNQYKHLLDEEARRMEQEREQTAETELKVAKKDTPNNIA